MPRKSSKGFSEEPPRYDAGAEPDQDLKSAGPSTGKIDGSGRLLIPAELRAAMQLGEDGRVSLRVVDGQLQVLSPMAGIKRVQERMAKYKKPGESVVDEFLAERRAMWGEE